MAQDSIEELTTFLYVRLQRECFEFSNIINHLEARKKSRKSDWRDVDIEPESKASKVDNKIFFQLHNFKYLDPNGDTVKVNITDSTWEDHFLDGTFSRLSLSKLNANEFIITFIESNNKHRKN